MGESKSVAVCWRNHYRAIVDGLWNLFVKKHRVDVEIACNGHHVQAHELLLAILFPSLLDSSAEQTKHGTKATCRSVNLDGLGDGGVELDFMMEFMYRGQIDVPENRLSNLKKSATTLGFKWLVEAIDDVVTDNLKEENERQNRRKRKRTPVKISKILCEVNDSESTCDGTEDQNVRQDLSEKRYTIQESICEQKSSSDDSEEDEDDHQAVPTLTSEDEEDEEDEELEDGDDDDDEDFAPGKSKRPSKISRGRQSDGSKSTKSTSNPKPRKKNGASRSENKKIWRQNRPPLRCPHCDYETRDKDNYSSHLAKHDPSAERYSCEICSKKFRSKQGFLCHQRGHLPPDKLHKCLLCDFHTPQKSGWVKHLAVIHKIDRHGEVLPENYKCTECDYVCVAKHKLKVHILRKHSVEKPFKCTECDYATFFKYDLDKHIGIRHRNERPYMCEVCGFRSQTQSGYERHKRSHTGEKPYKCEICGQAYADSRKLKIHLQRHVKDEKPFICQICGHACRRKDNLQMHLRRIHKTTLDGDLTNSGLEDVSSKLESAALELQHSQVQSSAESPDGLLQRALLRTAVIHGSSSNLNSETSACGSMDYRKLNTSEMSYIVPGSVTYPMNYLQYQFK